MFDGPDCDGAIPDVKWPLAYQTISMKKEAKTMESLLKHAPQLSAEDASRLAKNLYALQATATPLPSERDQNFLLTAAGGQMFVLKIANALEDITQLEGQNQAMLHLARRNVSICQQVLPTQSGDFIAPIQSPSGAKHWARLLTYLPGKPLGQLKRHSPHLLANLGRSLAQIDRALAGFEHPAARREFHWDLAQAQQVVNRHKTLITDPELRALIDKFVADFERFTAPLLPQLRQSVIHNDANDYNVIVGGGDDLYTRHQQVVGIIDFGDIVHSYTVGDLAIATAYVILNKADPLAAAAQVAQGYHAIYPLTEAELAALFGLVGMRLCVSACLAAYQQQQRPNDEYLAISQQPIRNTLPRLAQIHPQFAEATIRQACGLEPLPAAGRLRRWLQHKAGFAPVLGVELNQATCHVFDLGVGSPLIYGDPQANSEPALTRRLFEKMESVGAQVGVGRYNEPRLIYTADTFASGDTLTDERRTIHLGIDLFAPAGAPVYAPLAGKVYALADNDAPQDYGPVIILEHRAGEGQPFYTLYGHLSRESLDGLQAGQLIAAGQQFAAIGQPAENGGWPPHLHFQLITHLLELDGDFPGVGRAGQRQVWLQFSPDPNLILRIPDACFPPPPPDKLETLAARRKRIGPSLSIGYRNPVKILRGWRQYLYDDTGRQYLDAYNNVPHVGHCHPRVVQAACEQMSVLNTNTRYLHDYLNLYAERLAATMPEPLNVCFFVNSASEANELALRLVRAHTGQRDMIVLEGAYHGHTTSLIDISPYKHNGPGGGGAPEWVHTAPLADGYRGPYKSDDPQAGPKYARHVAEIIERLQKRGLGLGGFIAESCPSVGGQIIFPPDYLAEVYRHVRQAGGLCIADEVQTGYGRIGTHFYAFESQNVTPDIVVLGKPIGNGHPIGAVVTTPEIAVSFDNGMEFFSTFGGNTVSCAVGLAVLDVVVEEKLQAHALDVGNYLLDGLRPLAERYEIVGDVRGSGLFLGVELVRNRATLEPAAEEAAFVANRMRQLGVLLGTDGPYHNVVKIRPPMPFTKQDADFLIAALDKVLSQDFG